MQMGSEKVKLLNMHVQHVHMRMLRFGFLEMQESFIGYLKINACFFLI